MKKLLLSIAFLMIVFSTTVGAAKVGDKIGEAVYSDLAAYINHYPIKSYIVNDYAVIVAEDLENYCCDVVWDENARTLNITKSSWKTTPMPYPVYKTSMPTGSYFTDVLYTDIKTYVNGNLVKSFNINGRTMIVIDEFGSNMDGYTWEEGIRAAKAWIDGVHITDYATLNPRAELLYNRFDSTAENYTGWHDVNFDGEKENISISFKGNDYDYGNIILNISGCKLKTIGGGFGIDAIYLCDIDEYDGVKDIAITSYSDSNCCYLEIYKCNYELTNYKFMDEDNNVKDYVFLRTSEGLVFDANDDGSISFRTEIFSAGIWDVTVNYHQNSNGVFVEKIPEYYELFGIFMKSRLESDEELQGHERAMWEKGYVKAYSVYKSNGFTINKDEYFKVKYDDGNGYIFVEKENGESGWIYMGYEVSDDVRRKLNDRFFYLAG